MIGGNGYDNRCNKTFHVISTSEALGNLTDFGYECRNCSTINRITLEDGQLTKQE
jgi:hypothetical protein